MTEILSDGEGSGRSGHTAVGKPSGSFETSRGRLTKTFLLPALHLIAYLSLSIFIVTLLDGYHAVSAASPRIAKGRKFKLRVSDVTSLISSALMVIRFFVSAWTGVVIWNCVFILLERQGLTLLQINRIVSFYLPPVPEHPETHRVVLLLLLVIPQQFISPILTGAVDWNPALEYSTLSQVKSGKALPSALTSWYYYSWGQENNYNNRCSSVRVAAAFSSMVWGGTSPDRHHCRHKMNSGSTPVGSVLLNATIPCIQIHSITFPHAPPENVISLVTNSAKNDNDSLSRIGDAPLSYFFGGNAVLFNPDNRERPLPPHDDKSLTMDYPTNFMQNGQMTAVVFIGGCTPFTGGIFGLAWSENKFEARDTNWCYSYAVVNFTAGVATSPTSTYISNDVVEADLVDKDMKLRPGPWVQEAMYLMPDVMSMVSNMNTTVFHTWKDLENYTSKLIRYSYQASWDMLFRLYDTNITKLNVEIYEPRLKASVSRSRVFSWVAVSSLMTLSASLLVFGGWKCERKRVVDGAVAALMTDPTGLLGSDCRWLTDLSYVVNGYEKIGKIRLEKANGGDYALI
jgi:hypothetical protein